MIDDILQELQKKYTLAANLTNEFNEKGREIDAIHHLGLAKAFREALEIIHNKVKEQKALEKE